MLIHVKYIIINHSEFLSFSLSSLALLALRSRNVPSHTTNMD